MQPIVRAFVEDALEVLDPPDPVVEFGARQVERERGPVSYTHLTLPTNSRV